MKILVDLDKCQGYGNCVMAAPEVFDLSEAGKVVVLDTDTSDVASLRQGVRECPAHALELAE
ncbi:ferredoxin [Streptomyces sp. NPDC005774]|uniref:ferredoxin n=1 Tax=Streptomyces TaxID=1883 RepID=UPI0033ECB87A